MRQISGGSVHSLLLNLQKMQNLS